MSLYQTSKQHPQRKARSGGHPRRIPDPLPSSPYGDDGFPHSLDPLMEEGEEGEEMEPEGQYFMDLAGNVKKARFKKKYKNAFALFSQKNLKLPNKYVFPPV